MILKHIENLENGKTTEMLGHAPTTFPYTSTCRNWPRGVGPPAVPSPVLGWKPRGFVTFALFWLWMLKLKTTSGGMVFNVDKKGHMRKLQQKKILGTNLGMCL